MITIITGIIRRGKTSLNTFLSLKNARDGEKRGKMKIHTANLKRAGYNINPREYALYSNYQINYNEFDGKIVSQIIDINRLGLAEKDVTYIRPFSTVSVCEGQTYFGSKIVHRLKPEQQRYFAESGHFGIDFIIDCPRADVIDPDIRNLCERFIVVNSRDILDNNGKALKRGETVDRYSIGKIIWNCTEYADNRDFEREKCGEKTKIICDYNIFDCYNAFNNYQNFLPLNKKTQIL